MNNIQIKHPQTFSREFIYSKTDYVTLTGKTTRDLTGLKQKFTLGFVNLTKAQVDYITTTIELRTAVNFYISDPAIDTTVWPYVAAITYEMLGTDYRATMTLELIEVQ